MKFFAPHQMSDFMLRICVPLLLFCGFSSNAQQSTIRFNHLNIDDGLSLSSVYCIYEDQKGFKWFATEDGLNRYDGKNFTIFREEANNPNSLSYKWTELIYEDSRGWLWLGSKGGLTRLKPETETFTKFTRENYPSGIANDTITQIIEGPDKRIWVGTISGLSVVYPNIDSMVSVKLLGTEKIHTYAYIHSILTLSSDLIFVGTNQGLFSGNPDEGLQKIDIPGINTIYSIKKHDDKLWMACDKGLVELDFEFSDIKTYSLKKPGINLENIPVEKFTFDCQQNIWATTPDGLYRFNTASGNFTKIVDASGVNQSLSISGTRPFIIDKQQYAWYGTYGSGLFKIDLATLETSQYTHNTGDPNSLSQNSINCLYEDRAGVIWIGTFGAGINIYDKYAHKFPLITHNPQNPNSLSENFIWSICEAKNGSLWVGTNSGGLNHFDKATGTFTHYHHEPENPNSLGTESVREVFQESDGTIWIGTDGGGLNRFIPETKSFIRYKTSPEKQNTISNNSVRVIYEDRTGNLWVGTRNGLNKFDKKTGTFKRFLNDPDNPESISHNFVYSSIKEDVDGNIWIGTYGGGLNKMNPGTETFKSFSYSPEGKNSISNNIVFSIYEENDSILWIGTNDGLNRFNRKSEKFQRFGTAEGLPNDVVYGILPDHFNNLWLSTNFGLSRFNLSNLSTINFDNTDGLQSNEFNGGAFFKGPGRKLFFGGVYGLNVIDPDHVIHSTSMARLVIVSIDLMGKKVQISRSQDEKISAPINPHKITEFNGNYFMQTAAPYTYEIHVDYKHRFLSFEFLATNLPPSQQPEYSYKMENLEDNWTFAGDRNYVTYANLSPGKYIFKVKASNDNRQITAHEAALLVNVAYPFWRTWWFYAIEFLLAFTLVGFIYTFLLKSRTNKLLTVQNQRIQEANQQLSESEKKLKELNSAKDKFFSIIAHDLKNPFTSLLSIGELLSKNYDSLDEDDKKSGIDGFYNASKRIYALLENLLLWSRTQTGRVKFNPEIFELDLLAEECYDLMALNAEKKNVDFRIHIPDEIPVKADREMIHTVLRNLLHNAIKFSNRGGKVVLKIEEKEPGLLKIAVSDNGVGIPKEKVEKLFNLASKTNSDGTAGEKGTGLGLIVCKEFVERNGSKLLVKSKEGEGSEFSFYMQAVKLENVKTTNPAD